MGTKDIRETRKVPRQIASRLRQERQQRGWTQSDLAERIGTTQINVSRWENGVTVPGPYYRQRLGELFGKNMEELGFFPGSSVEQAQVMSPLATTTVAPLSIWN